MTEHLNEKEKAMLVYIGKQYKQYYDTSMDISAYDYCIVDGKPVGIAQNILKALRIREYIHCNTFQSDAFGEIRYIDLTEKALNLFNSHEFDKWMEIYTSVQDGI
ncbi:MAG: hypothetical protein IJO14_00950 [Clostridia bacterium]|nr:hypothetical protein [Clostridia bacterium]